MTLTGNLTNVPRWGRFEVQFTSFMVYSSPVHEVDLAVVFRGPSGESIRVGAFWDGDNVWRVRFSPAVEGEWSYATVCSNAADLTLHAQTGRFRCDAPSGDTRFQQHGPIRLSINRRYLEHADGTPFFWIADTAWNGPLLARTDEWADYLTDRVRKKFTAVQWIGTQWLASPGGDLNQAKAFSGVEKIGINPAFFQRLDLQLDAVTRVGLLNVPVLLWSAEWSTPEANGKNPGCHLPEDQIVVLARYLVSRWSASPVVWILPGDGDYRGLKADRWRRIGRTVFGDQLHAPVMLHPAGMQWNSDEFREESWLDLLGYQSGHGDDQATLRWLVSGPPATDWKNSPARPIINLEPPYEDHIAYHSQTRIGADFVRRALYWSVLVSPAAGVSYGAHGLWGWDDGTVLSEGHPNAGRPQSWRKALDFTGAKQVAHLADLFASISWWRLMPEPKLLLAQPGGNDCERFVAAAQSGDGDLVVIYVPRDRSVELVRPLGDHRTIWFNPRDGSRGAAESAGENRCRFTTPGPGDWVLVAMRAQIFS
jgi:hypothetical protein